MLYHSTKLIDRDVFDRSIDRLIMTGPEHLIDSHGYAQRWIKNDIIEHGNEPLYLAHLLLSQRQEDVFEALKIYGQRYLGNEKHHEVLTTYKKLYAADWLAEVMCESDYRHYAKQRPFKKRERSEIDKTVEKMVHDFGAKALIASLPFSDSSMLFVSPTPQKEKIIQEFFPQVSAENIHEWLTEGATLASGIYERVWQKSRSVA